MDKEFYRLKQALIENAVGANEYKTSITCWNELVSAAQQECFYAQDRVSQLTSIRETEIKLEDL